MTTSVFYAKITEYTEDKMAGKKGSSTGKSSSGNKGRTAAKSPTKQKGGTTAKRTPVHKGKKVEVIQESDSGRNERFRDPTTGQEMSREDFVRKIEQGQYPAYHIREIDGIKTPVSNPDKSEGNNLD
jgi:hypothetical protein